MCYLIKKYGFKKRGKISLVYIINSGFLFVVCSSRTIFGNRKGAHVQIEEEKHGNKDTELNMVCKQ